MSASLGLESWLRRKPVLQQLSKGADDDLEPLARVAYDQHFDSVWRTLRRLGVPETRLEDVAQDVFVVVHRRRHEFDGTSTLRTWVLGIAVRAAANARRRAQRERQRFAEMPELATSSNYDPEQVTAKRQAIETLQRVLESLSPEHRELLVLVELENLAVADAALALGIKLSSCYKRLSAARDRFNAQAERLLAEDQWRLK